MRILKVFTTIILLFLTVSVHANIQKLNSDLIKAAKKGKIEKVKAALISGASINGVDKKGRTALMFASEKGQTEVVKYLLASGAETNLTNNKGETASDLAKKKNKNDIVTLIAFAENYLNNDYKEIFDNKIENGTLNLLITFLEEYWGKDINLLPNHINNKEFFEYFATLRYIPTTYGNAWDSKYWKNIANALGSLQRIALLYDAYSYEASYLYFNNCKISVLCFCRKNYTEFSSINYKTVEDAFFPFSEDYDKAGGGAPLHYFEAVGTRIYPDYLPKLIEITCSSKIDEKTLLYNLEQLVTWIQIVNVNEDMVNKIERKFKNHGNQKIKNLSIKIVTNYKKSKYLFPNK